MNQNKLILYESDNGGLYNVPVDQAMSMTVPTANPQLGYQKLLMEKQMLERETENRQVKVNFKKPTGPSFKRNYKEEQVYKYSEPVKDYPSKYKETKIRIWEDVKKYEHHRKHAINVFFNQYNEFVKLVFKTKQDKNPSDINH